MQAAVFIGYLSGLFALLGIGASGVLAPLMLIAAIAMAGGAFGVANNKRVGWIALLAGSSLFALLGGLRLLLAFTDGINPSLEAINALIFPVALVAAVVHPHTRDYMKAWFE